MGLQLLVRINYVGVSLWLVDDIILIIFNLSFNFKGGEKNLVICE